jgi:hypothetical protein
MNWIKVDGDDSTTLPPIGEIVWLCYRSGYDGGPVVQLGGRDYVEQVDDDSWAWSWGTLDTAYFARNWEKKLYGLEMDDDYDVTHWAALEWPEDQS